jgi:hypothetical protein
MGTAQLAISDALDRDGSGLYRVGAISAVTFGLAYVVIFPLYASVGAPPDDGATWLSYAAGKTTAWWAILALSVLTDFLLVPIALSLYLVLRSIDRNAMLISTAFVGLFVVLDLAVTWPNFASLITLSGDYAAASTDSQRAVYVAAAQYPSAVLSSVLLGAYSIVTLAIALLVSGVVMLHGGFSRVAGFLGVASGILGIVSVAGPFVVSASSLAVIVASVLTTIWAFAVGYRLYHLGR